MNYETLMRIDSIVAKQTILDLQESIQAIADQMEDDGFEPSDVKAFIKLQLDEMLGTDKALGL
jgi:hypothetical protein